MQTFLVEGYAGDLAEDACTDQVERARRAARQLSANGTLVRHLRSIFVPEDETCFHLFEAETEEAVARLTRLAGLSNERIVEAV